MMADPKTKNLSVILTTTRHFLVLTFAPNCASSASALVFSKVIEYCCVSGLSGPGRTCGTNRFQSLEFVKVAKIHR